VFRPRSKEHPEDETFSGLLLLRMEGRVFFANAEHIAQKIRLLVEEAQPSVVAFDLSGVFDLEYTALKIDRTRTTRADSSFLLRYGFPKNMSTNTRTCFLS
jgi:MFS superfamily sulfate permease-like transporter